MDRLQKYGQNASHQNLTNPAHAPGSEQNCNPMELSKSFQRLSLALAIGILVGIERGWQERGTAPGKRTAGIRTSAYPDSPAAWPVSFTRRSARFCRPLVSSYSASHSPSLRYGGGARGELQCHQRHSSLDGFRAWRGCGRRGRRGRRHGPPRRPPEPAWIESGSRNSFHELAD